MRALILSAGLGERLRPLTLKRAKPALEFLNMPMLAFPYYWLDTLGLSDVVFNTHHLADTIRLAAMHVVNPNTQLHFVHEDAILGSGGGIWNARFHLQWDAHFAVANGDAVVCFAQPDTLERMWREHQRSGALATMLVCPLEGVGTRIPGVWCDSYGQVVNFGKTAAREGLTCLHYASFMFISERIWKFLPEGPSNILYDVFAEAMRQGERVHAHRVDDMRWFETGNAEDYLRATANCLELLRGGSALAAGLASMLERFAPHARLVDNRLIDDGATVNESEQLRGFAVMGDGSVMGDGARLENCVVLPGAWVEAGARLRDQILL